MTEYHGCGHCWIVEHEHYDDFMRVTGSWAYWPSHPKVEVSDLKQSGYGTGWAIAWYGNKTIAAVEDRGSTKIST